MFGSSTRTTHSNRPRSTSFSETTNKSSKTTDKISGKTNPVKKSLKVVIKDDLYGRKKNDPFIIQTEKAGEFFFSELPQMRTDRSKETKVSKEPSIVNTQALKLTQSSEKLPETNKKSFLVKEIPLKKEAKVVSEEKKENKEEIKKEEAKKEESTKNESKKEESKKENAKKEVKNVDNKTWILLFHEERYDEALNSVETLRSNLANQLDLPCRVQSIYYQNVDEHKFPENKFLSFYLMRGPDETYLNDINKRLLKIRHLCHNNLILVGMERTNPILNKPKKDPQTYYRNQLEYSGYMDKENQFQKHIITVSGPCSIYEEYLDGRMANKITKKIKEAYQKFLDENVPW